MNSFYAGPYRDAGVRIVGSQRTFPAPESLGEHMSNFRDSFNIYQNQFHPVTLTAFTYLWFVLIHHFC
ncbi:MAG: Fic family protein [Deltaproteobacteria bacterium]|nr:Fic family protein [Deltaproteobacteria bacterium]